DLGRDARRVEHHRRRPVAALRIGPVEGGDAEHAHLLAAFAALDQRREARDEIGVGKRLVAGPGGVVLAEKEIAAEGGFGAGDGISRCSHPRRMLSSCPPRGEEKREIQSSTSSAFWNFACANSCSEPMASATLAPYAGASSISCSPSTSRSCFKQM